MSEQRNCAACGCTLTDAAPSFESLFQQEPEVESAAPGRVNLIGEHTDYNDGFVLPIAIPQQTTVRLSGRTDRNVRAWSANVAGADQEQAFGLGMERPRAAWIDYVQGVTSALQSEGITISGFDMHVTSAVPLGAGLSSSASLEVAVLRALNSRFGLGLDPVAIARIAHRAEAEFVGVPVGMMDQMAASLASTDAALFIDTRSLAYERVPIPSAVELLVIDSGITHEHAGGEYRTRRAECEAAARALGVPALRDADATLLRAHPLTPPLDRRARHVVTENERVIEMRRALNSDNMPAAGGLMNASHRSMRDDFDVSTPEIDLLVFLAQNSSGVVGARLTGGGFGGCIVALVNSGRAREVGVAVSRAYQQHTHREARVLIPE
jgi:galactokinase